MAINKNHEFEELNGVRCAIVEKNATKGRMEFLKTLLEINQYTVIAEPNSVIKTDSASNSTANETAAIPPRDTPETFTIGVTDVTFNSINAVYGRLLKTKEGTIVTPAYWKQQDLINREDIPYYEQA